jgi:GTP-binding protein Era
VSRAGIVALAGRPNVGKSTFLNAAVGEKVAITSDRPQTTRRAIRGVHEHERTQVGFVDLPGFQRPRDALTSRMASRLQQELEGADAALQLLAADQGVGPGDRYIAETLGRIGLPVTLAVNKVDRLGSAELVPVLDAAARLVPGAEVFPISSRRGTGIEALLEHLRAQMPESPLLFGPGERSDQPLTLLVAELIREALIRRTYRELPHASEVVVEEIERRRASLHVVRALIWVESDSQKAIVVGAQGKMIKAIGIAARLEIERELGSQVHLDLAVRVRRDWRADEGLLDRLGIS